MKLMRIINLLIVFLFLFSINNISAADEEYLAFAEKMPEVIGGMKEIYKGIQYPESARVAGTQGRVYCLVFIDENGNVTDVKKIKGIGNGCDEVAMEALKKSKFSPGFHNGSNVKVKLALAIEFKLS